MSEHHASLSWRRTSADLRYETYNRAHEWRFKGGNTVKASATVQYRGDAERVDPEEAFVASLSSCHMLTFLAIAARKKLSVDAYEDEAVGYMEKNAQGKLAITRVVLRPKITFSEGVAVGRADLDAMHHAAHTECFIANSVTTDVRTEPRV